ncbi:heme A synthase [uncultured Microbacterium sp.]|uniref:COX15/CtaA family protein n=1 Tax=uncultured Microbacterium sp. TaxID=191216 RepID=UPI0025DAD744|nr:COX15/CtaA family protein [uncultured Microbacterium sp.]
MPSASSPAATTRVPAPLRRIVEWLPTDVDRRVRVFAWLSFIAEVLIIGTGGAVRLTGSGLGCPTWPRCTPDSLVNTPEMGIHGIIEFGNRTLTGLVGILALAVVVLMWRMRHERRVLFVLSLVVLVGIIAQAVVGGITVLTGLNPFIVGFHYIASVSIVAVCAAFLVRMKQPVGPRLLAAPRWFAGLVHATTGVLALTIVFGVLTTGAGPHSGDASAGRNGFDAEVLEHVHSWPGYALFTLTLVAVIASWRLRLPARRWAVALLAVELVQIAVGLYQARNGLPEWAVGTHMVLAALAAATMTVVVLRLKVSAIAGRQGAERETAAAHG